MKQVRSVAVSFVCMLRDIKKSILFTLKSDSNRSWLLLDQMTEHNVPIDFKSRFSELFFCWR